MEVNFMWHECEKEDSFKLICKSEYTETYSHWKLRGYQIKVLVNFESRFKQRKILSRISIDMTMMTEWSIKMCLKSWLVLYFSFLASFTHSYSGQGG